MLATVFSNATILLPSGESDAARYLDFRVSFMTSLVFRSISLITEYSLFSHIVSICVSPQTSLSLAYEINIGYICPGVCSLFSVFWIEFISTNEVGEENVVLIAIILSAPASRG